MWLTDFNYFLTLHPNQRFQVGVSGVEPLRSEARERAIHDVCQQLKVRPQTVSDHIVGTFTQTIQRPYGLVYREVILVQDSSNLSTMAMGSNNHQGGVLSSWGLERGPYKPSFEFGLALIVCLTVVLNFVANVATQGCCQRRISWLIWGACGVGVGLLFLMVVLTFA